MQSTKKLKWMGRRENRVWQASERRGKKNWHEVSARGESLSWQGSHNLVAKKPVTRVRKPRIVSNKKTNTPPPPQKTQNTESNGRNTTGRVTHMHFSTFQVTTLLSLSFQHLPAKILMLVYREQQPITTYYYCVVLP